MDKKQIITILSFTILLGSCNGQTKSDINNLAGSIWLKNGEYCTDSLLLFPNNKYREYYCEFQEYMEGIYQFKDDTLTLTEYKLSSEVLSNNPKLEPAYIWKYIFIDSTSIQKVYYKDIQTKEESIGTDISWTYIRK